MARVYRWVGIRGALIVLPVIAALGYGLMAFVPIFSIIRLVKIGENSVNYSLMNTTRQALFLPVDRDAKYEGKTAIDTFFWRIGDLIQAGVVFAGLHWLDWTTAQFALLNLALALVWIGLAFAIGREFRALAQRNSFNVPPEVGQPIPDLLYAPGQPFRHFVPADAFRDADPGDVLQPERAARGGRAAAAMGAVRRAPADLPRHLSGRLLRGGHDRGRGERRRRHAGREPVRDAPRAAGGLNGSRRGSAGRDRRGRTGQHGVTPLQQGLDLALADEIAERALQTRFVEGGEPLAKLRAGLRRAAAAGVPGSPASCRRRDRGR